MVQDQLEARVGREFTGPRAGEPVLSYLVEFVSVLLSRHEVVEDGKIANERLRETNQNFWV